MILTKFYQNSKLITRNYKDYEIFHEEYLKTDLNIP